MAALGEHNLRKVKKGQSFQSDTRLGLWVKGPVSLLHAPRSLRTFPPNLSFHCNP